MDQVMLLLLMATSTLLKQFPLYFHVHGTFFCMVELVELAGTNWISFRWNKTERWTAGPHLTYSSSSSIQSLRLIWSYYKVKKSPSSVLWGCSTNCLTLQVQQAAWALLLANVDRAYTTSQMGFWQNFTLYVNDANIFFIQKHVTWYI